MAKKQQETLGERILILICSVLIVGFIFIIAPCISFYNGTVEQEENINSGIGQIQNYYQRRYDLIPNLVEVVKGYAKHENQTLIAVAEARAKAGQTKIDASNLSAEKIAQFENNQKELSGALTKLLVIVENYPELKANKNFLELQTQLVETENGIVKIRGNYHKTVQSYNIRIKGFPGMIFAHYAGWKTYPYFQADLEAQKAPKIKL